MDENVRKNEQEANTGKGKGENNEGEACGTVRTLLKQGKSGSKKVKKFLKKGVDIWLGVWYYNQARCGKRLATRTLTDKYSARKTKQTSQVNERRIFELKDNYS